MKIMFNRDKLFRLRLILVILLSFSMIILDKKFKTFDLIRTYIDTAISPIYFILDKSIKLFSNVSQRFSSRNQLELENHLLHQELLVKNSELLILEQYKKENECLRNLLNSPLRQNERKILAQVIYTINNPYSNQLIVDKGSTNGVYEGQPVVSDRGIIGQVISVSKLTSRVLLICDASHALPVQVLRNNVRVIVFGNGCYRDLQLEYLPINVDICVGDILVSSGIGGKFPEGYPVAIVSSVKLDKRHSHLTIQARPIACLQYLQYLLLIWKEDQSRKNESISTEKVCQIANERLTRTPKSFFILGKIKNQILKKFSD